MHCFLEVVLVVLVYDLFALHAEKGAEVALPDVVEIAVFLLQSLVEDFGRKVESVFEKLIMDELVGVNQLYDLLLGLLELCSQDADQL